MTSKVLVKLPTVAFSQGKKSAPELVTLPARNDVNGGGGSGESGGGGGGSNTPLRSQQGMTGERTAQLEQNMKFLQDQHQATLIALHQEVELLRQRNRDLQFQLVFTKGTASVPSPLSPEDNTNGFVKTKGSPVCVNVTPLQIELLERDFEELKTSFNEAKKENLHLKEVIEKQNLKLEQAEEEKKQLQMSDIGVQVGDTSEPIQSDLTARLEDADILIKRLRRENSDQRKEIATIKASSARNGNRSGHGRGRGNENGHHSSRGSSGDPGQSSRNSYKFPPLEGESYWRSTGRGRSSYDHHSGQHNRRNRLEKDASEPSDMSHIVGPGIVNSGRFSYDHPMTQRHRRIRSDKDDNETNISHVMFPELQKRDMPCYSTFYQPERGFRNGGGNGYNRDGGGFRKFRGQSRGHRDRGDQQDNGRDQSQQHQQQNRNDYKDRNNSKEQSTQQHQHHQQQRNFNDGAHSSKKHHFDDLINSLREKHLCFVIENIVEVDENYN
ncbi:hypothetical protein PV328_008735 [Microctonus aethiopoides]|uniref:CCDC92/74 N-terminal domain-containing protein n=1 Tax=Microctonus aethiopoides TaxID=144406 RepID=A0AA39FKG7_9HYME|nr:hypothetical protein PV328_008735 [Microctonus aethiopoides]